MMHVTDYWKARRLINEDFPFYAALTYLVLKADSDNLEKIRSAWPGFVEQTQARYNAPAGALTDDEKALAQKLMDAGKMNVFGEVEEK